MVVALGGGGGERCAARKDDDMEEGAAMVFERGGDIFRLEAPSHNMCAYFRLQIQSFLLATYMLT